MASLVLGGSGFIGSNLLLHLLQQEDDVRVFDRQPPAFSLDTPEAKRIHFVEGSFCVETDFLALTQQVDTVYHLISTTHAGSKVPVQQDIVENVLPTVALLEACVKNGVKNFVFLSSGGTVYGRGNSVPLKEDDTLSPINPYGVQKVTIEKCIHHFGALRGLPYRIIRAANPYGPGQNPLGGQGAVAAFAWKVLHKEPIYVFGDGKTVRDYIYIDDLCKGIVNITRYNGEECVFNLGTGQGHTLLDVLTFCEMALGQKANVIFRDARAADVPYSVLDMALYQSLIDPGQPIVLQDGIQRLMEYYRQHHRYTL